MRKRKMRKRKYYLYRMLRPINRLGAKFWQKIVSMVEHLQDVNQDVKKLLADMHTKTNIRVLICQIKGRDWIDNSFFYKVYDAFIEMKRQCMIEEANRIDAAFIEEMRERWDAKLPHKGLAPEIRMKLAVLNTCASYLKNDSAFEQRAFELFLKKKKEETSDEAYCERIDDCLYSIHRNFDYDVYNHCMSIPIVIGFPELWIDFFKSGAGYSDILPREWPNVAYISTNAYIPRFVFDKPYDREYSEKEFRSAFAEEWSVTHYDPSYDDDDDYAPIYRAEYEYEYECELDSESLNAYCFYVHAVGHFKQIQQALNENTADNGGE